jgi:hypothetical protein
MSEMGVARTSRRLLESGIRVDRIDALASYALDNAKILVKP